MATHNAPDKCQCDEGDGVLRKGGMIWMVQILAVLDKDVVWVNPDCGLKTRKYEQVRPALENMVAAAKKLRKEVAV